MEKVQIFSETGYITLGQFLKFKGIIFQGSEVKEFLIKNRVYVNNMLENRRGRKLYLNDIVTIANQKWMIEIKR